MLLLPRIPTTVIHLTLLLFTGCGLQCDLPARVTYALADDDQTVVYTTQTGDLMSLDRTSGNSTKLLTTGERFDAVAISPDGKLVAATTHPPWSEQPEIVLLERDEQGSLTETARLDGFSAAFGDASELYYAKGDRWVPVTGFGGGFWTDYTLWKHSIVDGQSRQLFTKKYFQIDGVCVDMSHQQVYFSAVPFKNESTVIQLYRLDEASGEIEQMTEPTPGGASGAEPAISPDGEKLVFISDRAQKFNYDLYSQPIDSTEATSLGTVSKFSYVRQPVFSSDGRRVYFFGVTNPGANADYELWEWTAPDHLERVVEKETFKGNAGSQ